MIHGTYAAAPVGARRSVGRRATRGSPGRAGAAVAAGGGTTARGAEAVADADDVADVAGVDVALGLPGGVATLVGALGFASVIGAVWLGAGLAGGLAGGPTGGSACATVASRNIDAAIAVWTRRRENAGGNRGIIVKSFL